jgi:hypothetical protein
MTTRKQGGTGPIRRELETRLIAKAAEANRLASSLPELVKLGFAATPQSGAIATPQQGIESVRCVMEELAELTSWLGPPLSVMSDDERSLALQAAQSIWWAEGFAPLEIVENLRIAHQKPHGRPATKRHLAVVALDMWLADPKLSWPRVTRRVCNCGESEHSRGCEEQLRQQVNDLRSALKKFGIEEPARARVRSEAI